MKKYRVLKEYILQKEKNKIKLFDSEQSILYTFNESASFIFERLVKSIPTASIVDQFAEKYHLTREVAEGDVNDFLISLKKSEIIEL